MAVQHDSVVPTQTYLIPPGGVSHFRPASWLVLRAATCISDVKVNGMSTDLTQEEKHHMC